jgi:4-aminobutyrate aminotransferase / (S)-3-amino-2-methylpropionate transaminase / 5-aminovalerate transaminase
MGKPFSIVPQDVPAVHTPYRRIQSSIPHPDSVPTLQRLLDNEPRAMLGQPPIVWARAEGVQVYDAYGNMWLDMSSGVLVTNAGHGIPAVRQAIIDQAESGLLHNYCFPSEERAQLTARLVELAPAGIEKCLLLTTGAETTECALKLARSWGQRGGRSDKIGIVSFAQGFHGRTLGAQQMGPLGGGNRWIRNLDRDIYHVPFPDGYRVEDTSFDLFLRTLEQQGITPDRIAGVMSETYQGVGPDFMPTEYAQRLRQWCDDHGILLIFDEVQAGFGRCGAFWGFELYGVTPDIFTCGKGITSSLPLGAVLGRREIMDQFEPGTMTSTHSGNPVCCRAALASIEAIIAGDMVVNARRLEPVLLGGLRGIQSRHPDVIGCVHGRGLVAGLQFVHPGTKDPDPDLAHAIVERCYQRGLLCFAPVGVGGACIKINPPLCITADALEDGLTALSAACDDAIETRRTL